METFVDGLIAERRASPRPAGARARPARPADAGTKAGGETERTGNWPIILIFLFVAGYDTSKNMLTLIFMGRLLDRPASLRGAAARTMAYARLRRGGEPSAYHSTTSNQRILDEDIVISRRARWKRTPSSGSR
jgi:cytochrome P450